MSSIISGVRFRAASLAVLSLLIIATPAVAFAATSGPNSGSTFSSVTSGTNSVAWTSPANAGASDTNYATASLGNTFNSNGDDNSQYIEATGFNFAIPSGATINGIQVSVVKKASNTNDVKDQHVFLLKGGVLTTSDKKSSTAWGTSDATATYGSTSDLWGTTWTPADINASNFGFALSASNGNFLNNRTASINYISITVTYTPSALSNQTITVTTHAPASAVFGQTFPVAATASSNLAVAITTAGGCSIPANTTSSGTVTMTSASTACVVNYNQAGNGSYSAAPQVTDNTTAGKANTTDVTNAGTLGTASTVNIAYPVSYTVSVNSPGAGTPTGNVLVSDGAATCTGTVAAGTCNLTSTTVGTKTITSRYLGDTNFNASATSTGVSHTVNAAAGPTVTINQATGQADPTSNSPINFTVIFSSSVSDFATGDVTLSGTAGATTATVTGSGTTYSVAVSGMTQSGTVIASIAAGVAHDASNNPNSASTATDNTVTYNAPGVACSLSAPTDLILNPCLEISSTPFDGTLGGPDNWNFYIDSGVTGGGTYPAASYYSGTNAAEVHITALPSTGGEAQWSPSPVNVTPGQAYTYSDEYLSNVDTEADVEYIVDKNNPILEDKCTPDSNSSYIDCYEVLSSSVKASPTSFSKFTAVITPPPGTVQASVFQLLDQVGSLTIDDGSLSAGVSATNQYSQGMVSLSFDDGYLDQFAASTTLNAAGMHGTYYIIPNDTLNYTQYHATDGSVLYMSPEQVLQMQAAGNEIASHTADHCDLVALEANPNSATVTGVQGAPGVGCPDHALVAATTSQAEILNSKIEMQTMGISPDNNMAYPFGSFDSTITGQAATRRLFGRAHHRRRF